MKKVLVSVLIVLLSVNSLASIALAASPPVEVNLLFKGTLQAQEMYTPEASGTILHVNANGSGNATQLGMYTLNYQVDVNSITGAGSNASAHFIAANGDSLYAEGSGQSNPTQTPNVFRIVEVYTITGGTGRFAQASGSFTVERQVSVVTGATSGTFSGNIELH